jgi:hypothetical protein
LERSLSAWCRARRSVVESTRLDHLSLLNQTLTAIAKLARI